MIIWKNIPVTYNQIQVLALRINVTLNREKRKHK